MDRVFSLKNKTVWITGHRGLVGSAFCRRLQDEDCMIKTSDFNLKNKNNIIDFIDKNKIDYIIMAAAKVGGIHANMAYPADFITDNLILQTNLITAAHEANINHLLFLGSSCIYPKNCCQPMQEDSIMTGELEPTNAPYAMAKLAGLEMIDAYRRQFQRRYISVLPTNLYGPNDNFHPENAHVPAALIRRFDLAKTQGDSVVKIWGSGLPLREFMHVDDMVDACIFLMQYYDGDTPVNIGTGEEISIADFAHLIAKTVGYKGKIEFDDSMPDGASRKLLDCSKLKSMGWAHHYSLEKGLVDYYQWFLEHRDRLREK